MSLLLLLLKMNQDMGYIMNIDWYLYRVLFLDYTEENNTAKQK